MIAFKGEAPDFGTTEYAEYTEGLGSGSLTTNLEH